MSINNLGKRIQDLVKDIINEVNDSNNVNVQNSTISSRGSSVVMNNNELTINGEKIPLPPGCRSFRNVQVSNGKIKINGYRYINGEWKK